MSWCSAVMTITSSWLTNSHGRMTMPHPGRLELARIDSIQNFSRSVSPMTIGATNRVLQPRE